jgi:3-phytase
MKFAANPVPVLATLIAAFAVACSSGGPAPGPSELAAVAVPETWTSEPDRADNVDSVAVSVEQGWVLATTKSTHQLLVLDAATGELVRRFGMEGAGPGQFRRPNGIAVIGDLGLVVERDNHRVQVLALPDFEPLGVIGADVLERPYGIAVAASHVAVDLWVTDNFELPGPDPSGDPRLAERVRRFRLVRTGDGISSELLATFGETEGDGALWKVETIAVDPANDVLLVVDETGSRMGMRIYTLDGDFTGRVIGREIFEAEPEGIGLWTSGDTGYWVATDQHERLTVYHLFDRSSFDHVGSFTGTMIANTDGIAVIDEPVGPFPDGAMFAVHDDRSVAAVDWRRIARALELADRSR